MPTVSSTYVYNETLTGVVDGVNLVFTSANPIGAVEDMRIGGASYSSFTFDVGDTTITLTDAPTVLMGSPSIDYFVHGVNATPVGDTATFGEVIDSTYLLLGHDRTSEQFPETLVKEKLNEASRVLNNGRTNPKFKLGSFSFNPVEEMNVSSFVAGEMNVGSILAGTPASGLFIYHENTPVTYSSTSATSFLGVQTLYVTPEGGQSINACYALPGAAKKVSAVYVDGTELQYVDFRSFKTGLKSYGDELSRYSLWRDAGTGVDYLCLPSWLDADDVVTVHYTTANLQYDDDADVVDFEAEYRQLLSLYAAYKVLKYREDDRWQSFQQEFLEEQKLYKNYVRRTEGMRNKITSTALRGF